MLTKEQNARGQERLVIRYPARNVGVGTGGRGGGAIFYPNSYMQCRSPQSITVHVYITFGPPKMELLPMPMRKHLTSFSPSILLSLLCSSQLVSHSFLLSTHFLLNACHRDKQKPCHHPTQSNQGRTVGSRDKNCHLCQVRIFSFQIIRAPSSSPGG